MQKTRDYAQSQQMYLWHNSCMHALGTFAENLLGQKDC